MYYAVSRKNRSHLQRYEAGNVLLSIETIDDAANLVQELAQGWAEGSYFFLGAFDKTDDEFVAQVYIGSVNSDLPEFSIGYIVDIDHEGQGYVTEAVQVVLELLFSRLNAHRVTINTDDTNFRSQRVAERCGFVKEGHIRENKSNPDGTITGTYHYGLLKCEYEDRCKT